MTQFDINIFVQADIDDSDPDSYSEDLERLRSALLAVAYVNYVEVMDTDDNKDIGLIDATV